MGGPHEGAWLAALCRVCLLSDVVVSELSVCGWVGGWVGVCVRA